MTPAGLVSETPQNKIADQKKEKLSPSGQANASTSTIEATTTKPSDAFLQKSSSDEDETPITGMIYWISIKRCKPPLMYSSILFTRNMVQ